MREPWKVRNLPEPKEEERHPLSLNELETKPKFRVPKSRNRPRRHKWEKG